MNKEQEKSTITQQESEELIERLYKDVLSADDKTTISKIIKGYVYLSMLVQESGIRIKAIRDFFFPKEKRGGQSQANRPGEEKKPEPDTTKPDPEPDTKAEPKPNNPDSYTDDVNKPLTEPPTDDKRRRPESKNKGNNNGRNSAEDFTGAMHEYCYHEFLEKGLTCPECQKGTLSKKKDKQQIQLYAGPIVQAINHHVEVLRCNACGAYFNARENSGRYQPSVKTMVGVSRYFMGIPALRLQKWQQLFGIPLPDSTQWELIKQLFDDVSPVFYLLIEVAAQSSLLHIDDTSGRILTLLKENKTLPKGVRHGTHSTGIVAVDEHSVILYFTGRSHAGENLDKLLDLRESDEKVNVMTDASPSNNSKRHADKTIQIHCNAHGVRKFKDIQHNFSTLCLHVLEVMGKVFKNEQHCKSEKMDDESRMTYHVKHSKVLLDELKTWMQEQLNLNEAEENSDFGYAIRYMLNHWENLTRFLTVPGAPLDNNIVERALKKLIVYRKNSLFFANEYSAYVGCALISIMMTCDANNVNMIHYLNCLQENRFKVARQPEKWLPWNYQQQALAMEQVA